MNDTADDPTVVNSVLAAHIPRQVRLDLPPLFVAQPEQITPHLFALESHRQRESATNSANNDFIGFWP
jgi:hypothetical protein